MSEILKAMAADPAEFRKRVVIEPDGTCLGSVLEPWQENDFAAMDGALMQAAGRADFDPATVRYSWSERPRGHSKSTDAAVSAIWFLLFATGPYPAIVAASDRDQGKLVRDAIGKLVRLNEWLSVLSVQTNDVIGRNGAKLSVISCDVGSSFGQTPRLVIADEVCHWPQGTGEELWGSLFSSAGKRRECCVLSITNAGMIGTWQHRLRDRIRDNPAWRFSRLDGPKASWISPETLDQQQRLLLPKQFARLWLNQWTDQEGDALDPDLIDHAIDKSLSPLDKPEPHYTYVAGLDLGLSSDTTGLAILGKHNRTRHLRLAAVRTWSPTKNTNVSIIDIERELRELHQRFRLRKIFVDDWQSRQLQERLQRDRIPIESVTVNSAMYSKMAKTLLSVFGDSVIHLYPHVQLIRDLRSISLVERPPGTIRLELPKTDSGHCDAAMGLLLAMEAAAVTSFVPEAGLPMARPSSLAGPPRGRNVDIVHLDGTGRGLSELFRGLASKE